MKRVKGLLALIMILTIMVGNFGLSFANTSEGEATYIGGFTTLENPNPVRE